MTTKQMILCNELTGPDAQMNVNSQVTGYQQDDIDEEIDTNDFEGGTPAKDSKK